MSFSQESWACSSDFGVSTSWVASLEFTWSEGLGFELVGFSQVYPQSVATNFDHFGETDFLWPCIMDLEGGAMKS